MKNAILAISERKETLKQIRKELSEQYEICLLYTSPSPRD